MKNKMMVGWGVWKRGTIDMDGSTTELGTMATVSNSSLGESEADRSL